jgi:hypothetical protein
MTPTIWRKKTANFMVWERLADRQIITSVLQTILNEFKKMGMQAVNTTFVINGYQTK